MERNWASSDDMAVLRRLLGERANLLVAGPTGTGKTSLLSALLAELPREERVVIVEDTDEIRVPNEASTKLLTRIDAQRNIAQSLNKRRWFAKKLARMRPQRLVVGEVRGNEAKDLLLALSTGHSGSFGSIHASSARQALLRLEMLVQMGAPDWSLETIRQLIYLSLHALIVVKLESGTRRLDGVYRISTLEKCGFLLEKY